MANYYCSFLEHLKLESSDELFWWHVVLLTQGRFNVAQRRLIDDADTTSEYELLSLLHIQILRDALPDDPHDLYEATPPEIVLEEPGETPYGYVVFKGSENESPALAAHYVRQFFLDCRLQHRHFTLTYAHVCDRDVPGSAGGGAYFVTWNTLQHIDAHDWAQARQQSFLEACRLGTPDTNR